MKLLLLSLLPLAIGAKLQIIEAGVKAPWKKGPELEAENTLCPADLFPKFSIECTGKPAKSATFYIDGEGVRTENVVPYVLSGDVDGIAYPWDPPKKAVVKCELSTGESVEAEIMFSCNGPKKTPKPEPGTEPPSTTEASEGTTEAPSTAEPSTAEPSTSEPTMTEPTTTEPTVTEPTTMTPTATEATEPPSTTEETGKPNTKEPSTTEVAEPGGEAPKNSGTCSNIPAKNYEMQKGWVMKDGGMAYKPDDDSTGIDSAGVAPMTYKFVPKTTARYALTIDMLTADGVDHNDVWVTIDGEPLSVEKKGSMKTTTGWIKAYHNKNGRAVEAFHVDFDPHAISSKNELKKGESYTVKLGGRSTKVVVYAVLLFPCEGDQCQIGSYWNGVVDKCK